VSRRDVLKAGGAVLCAVAAGRAAAAPARATASGVAPNAVAGAARAGRLTLGGDLVVNRIGFGAMRIAPGETSGRPDPTVAEATRVLRRAVDLGVNLIDTAGVYGLGQGEERIRAALHPYPKDLVIATKAGWLRPSMEASAMDGSPAYLRAACEASLKRLGLERIDLFQFHIPDPKVPLEDSIGELARLRDAGKIRHIGVSNVDLAQLERARRVTKIVSVQNAYNVGYRASEEVLRYCETHGLAFLPWAPLTRDLGGGLPGPTPERRLDPADGYEARMAEVQARHGLSRQQAAITWLMTHSARILPIPGTASPEHLEANIAAAAVRFSPEEMRAIG
jgi:aryl-alcohol dehydrogenase-like predicted oxidoreductase